MLYCYYCQIALARFWAAKLRRFSHSSKYFLKKSAFGSYIFCIFAIIMEKICLSESESAVIEHHPFEPFLPEGARLLMLGTFPPAEKRWCMKFYYPNFINDMWRIFGICFFDDKEHFVVAGEKRFDLERIIPFLREKGIALFDTATHVRRTKNTASDKDLEIVEATDLDAMLRALPACKAVVTAGQLATEVFCNHYGIAVPKVGKCASFSLDGRNLRLFRMPSSSRAYPMKAERKAEFYQNVFKFLEL